ncbi:hypothetical protein BDN72DRAFT_838834 [Pluteus cervinus]|uniref:Uncharacterized protein n=1 Tax=Pluteus cervinus TaxID=181527 RepID=A0ACD3AXZ4_9AGAR|nr:hypothetical protein BDN72DRAFT_838834 [Pluteus cervinus]
MRLEIAEWLRTYNTRKYLAVQILGFTTTMLVTSYSGYEGHEHHHSCTLTLQTRQHPDYAYCHAAFCRKIPRSTTKLYKGEGANTLSSCGYFLPLFQDKKRLTLDFLLLIYLQALDTWMLWSSAPTL